MKRDIDLIRSILIACENNEHGYAPSEITVEGYSAEEIGFHAHLMWQAGLVDAVDVSGFGDKSPQADITSLTNAGYDFLEHTRILSNWERVKTKLKDLGGWGLDTAITIASQVFKEYMKSKLL